MSPENQVGQDPSRKGNRLPRVYTVRRVPEGSTRRNQSEGSGICKMRRGAGNQKTNNPRTATALTVRGERGSQPRVLPPNSCPFPPHRTAPNCSSSQLSASLISSFRGMLCPLS